MFIDLYAKVASRSLTALKTFSKCSSIPYELRFPDSFRLVMKHDPCFCICLYRYGYLSCPRIGYLEALTKQLRISS
uniref:Uncharacterized protein n=1 Tax=Candidatus Kentrum sp. LPFa TaxID=2126335 RepID=A0A450Y382_9GAMM|nr:MAG: hypothetical protein BECKLPF1236C_GA0070990_104642 [Candidatus Kentron sp. LPFa]